MPSQPTDRSQPAGSTASATAKARCTSSTYQLHDPEIPLAGMVLIGPPGRSVGAMAHSQLAAQAASLPGGDVLMRLYDQSIERFLRGEPIAPDLSLPEGVQMLLRSLENPANLPFARELWRADAISLIAQVDVPVRVVIGKKDVQVSWTDDGEPLQHAAAGNDKITFAFPDDANHVLKHEARPIDGLTADVAAVSYNTDAAHLDETGTRCIIDWLARAAALTRVPTVTKQEEITNGRNAEADA